MCWGLNMKGSWMGIVPVALELANCFEEAANEWGPFLARDPSDRSETFQSFSVDLLMRRQKRKVRIAVPVLPLIDPLPKNLAMLFTIVYRSLPLPLMIQLFLFFYELPALWDNLKALFSQELLNGWFMMTLDIDMCCHLANPYPILLHTQQVSNRISQRRRISSNLSYYRLLACLAVSDVLVDR